MNALRLQTMNGIQKQVRDLLQEGEENEYLSFQFADLSVNRTSTTQFRIPHIESNCVVCWAEQLFLEVVGPNK